jgi:hypothetical protein
MTLPSVIRHPRLLRYVLRHPRVFALGWTEANSSNGQTFDGDPESARSSAYDTGRDLRRFGRA